MINKKKIPWGQQLTMVASIIKESTSRFVSKFTARLQTINNLKKYPNTETINRDNHSQPRQRFQSISVFFKRFSFLLQSFSIRVKLGLIMGAVVMAVILTLSLIVLHSEKKLLRERLDELCDVSVKSLSTSIKDYLLIDAEGPITEAIMRIKLLEISGLQDIWVINRSGKLMTYSSLVNEPASSITPEKSRMLLQLQKEKIIETESSYEYYYPIFIKRNEAGVEENILLGIAGLRFSKSVVFAPIKEAQELIITVMIVIILLTALVIYFLSQRMVLQIQELATAAKRIGDGDLNVRITMESRDELGRLGREFNQMIIGLQEKLQMQKFVSKMTMDMIKEQTNSVRPARESKKTIITVLFSDVRSFSTISEKLPPEDVVDLINIYLDLQARIVEQNYGIIDKFVGDQIMAIFDGENQVRTAVRCAVGIQKSINQLNQKRLKAGKVILEVGVGLNTGTAVIGHIGSQARMDYTVVGSTVNVGYHLCAQAKPRQIIATLRLLEQTNGTYPTKKIEPIRIKGKLQPEKIFEIDYDRELLI